MEARHSVARQATYKVFNPPLTTGSFGGLHGY